MAQGKAAEQSTVMPTEEFDAVCERLDAAVKAITGAKPDTKTETKTTFTDLLQKILRFLQKLMLRLFQGKGWSDLKG